MNRKDLEALIGFALHLRGRLDGTDTQANVARDALELSRLAKRLHYLDERYAQLDPSLFPTYFQKANLVLTTASRLLAPYGYWAHRLENDQRETVYGAMEAMPFSTTSQGHALAVPY